MRRVSPRLTCVLVLAAGCRREFHADPDTGTSDGTETTAASSTETQSEGPETSGETDSGESSGTETGTTGTPECGDGLVNGAEECDDSNLVDNDGCDADCVPSAVVEVSAAANHTCALTRTGTVRCWGYAAYGRLGYGSLENIGDDETPASAGDVMAGGMLVDVATGSGHTCAVVDGGTAGCWGLGSAGALGYGNTTNVGDDETPASAGSAMVGGAVAGIDTGGNHSCALLDAGAVRCWGRGTDGQLGYANTDSIGDDEAPASAGDVTVGGPVIQVSTGGTHTCALLDGGAVRCWGLGTFGRLGYGNQDTIGDGETPSSAGDVQVGGVVGQLSAASEHTCAILTGGFVRCWGVGLSGRLGYGSESSIGDDETPASAGNVVVGGTVAQLDGGLGHTCAVLDGGTVRCWGLGGSGQLGYGNTTSIGDNETPASAGSVDVGGKALQVSAGDFHTCAVLEGGTVRCWGSGEFGKLGYGTQETVGDDEVPAAVPEVMVFGP